MAERTCTKCGASFEANVLSKRRECGPCRAAYMRAWQRRRKYGVTPEQYAALVAAQEGVCAICCRPQLDGFELAVDHDRMTGKIRGLLCLTCNTVVDLVSGSVERLEAAAEYLRRA